MTPVPLRPIALLALLVWVLATPGARAGDPDPAALRVYDVRVLRVDLRDPELALASSFGDLAAPTDARPWPELLAVLRARGAVRLWVDRTVSCAPGDVAKVRQEGSGWTRLFDRADGEQVHEKGMPLREAVEVQLVPDGATLRYDARLEWREEGAPGSPVQRMAAWEGSLPEPAGATLVLRQVEQVPGGEAGALRGVEMVLLVTCRAPEDR